MADQELLQSARETSPLPRHANGRCRNGTEPVERGTPLGRFGRTRSAVSTPLRSGACIDGQVKSCRVAGVKGDGVHPLAGFGQTGFGARAVGAMLFHSPERLAKLALQRVSSSRLICPLLGRQKAVERLKRFQSLSCSRDATTREALPNRLPCFIFRFLRRLRREGIERQVRSVVDDVIERYVAHGVEPPQQVEKREQRLRRAVKVG